MATASLSCYKPAMPDELPPLQPWEYHEAIAELKSIVEADFEEFGAQGDLSPEFIAEYFAVLAEELPQEMRGPLEAIAGKYRPKVH
jgi:hypothetical protein